MSCFTRATCMYHFVCMRRCALAPVCAQTILDLLYRSDRRGPLSVAAEAASPFAVCPFPLALYADINMYCSEVLWGLPRRLQFWLDFADLDGVLGR